MWFRSLRGAGVVQPVLAVLLVAPFAAGSAAAQAICPDTTGVQANLNECAQRSYRASDDALNAAWSKARDWAAAEDERQRRAGFEGFDSVDGPKPASNLLLEAQRAWLVYRDNHCAAENLETSNGSMWPMTFTNCLERLTRERTEELESLTRSISFTPPASPSATRPSAAGT